MYTLSCDYAHKLLDRHRRILAEHHIHRASCSLILLSCVTHRWSPRDRSLGLTEPREPVDHVLGLGSQLFGLGFVLALFLASEVVFGAVLV